MKYFRPNISFTFLFVFFVQLCFAQTKLFTNDELPSEHIYQITQDNSGYVWILTDEGMVKYDGTNLKTFTVADGLPTNGIWNSAVTGDKIWYLSKGAEQGYIQNDSVHNFKLEKGSFMPRNYAIQDESVLLNDIYENIYKAKGDKWELIKENNLVNNDTIFYGNINLPNISHFSRFKNLSFL